MSAGKETFNANVLPDISPFTVDFAKTTTQERTSQDGRAYNVYVVEALGKGLSDPIKVEVFKRDYDRLRVLGLTGIKEFMATFGFAKEEGGFAPILFSGKNGVAGVGST